MAIQNNPLKQYFRRPAIYLKLPSGGNNYPEGVIIMTETGELPVYPMTAIDEITSKTPDALFNGSAIVDIIHSCIPNIKDPWQLTSVDLDAVLIAIRSAANGSELEMETICPACNEDAKYGLNLVGLLSTIKSGDYETELAVNDLLIKFRPLTFKEMNEVSVSQFDMQRQFTQLNQLEDMDEKNKRSKEVLKSITDTTMQALSKCIVHIKTPTVFVDENEFIFDFIQNCDKTMYEQIRDHNAFLKQQSESKPLKVKCIHCNHEYEQPFTLNVSDFFA
jgi:hypothetical protein